MRSNRIIQKAFRNSFVSGLCKLFDGTVQLLTLGYCYSCLDITHTEWSIRRSFYRRGLAPKPDAKRKDA